MLTAVFSSRGAFYCETARLASVTAQSNFSATKVFCWAKEKSDISMWDRHTVLLMMGATYTYTYLPIFAWIKWRRWVIRYTHEFAHQNIPRFVFFSWSRKRFWGMENPHSCFLCRLRALIFPSVTDLMTPQSRENINGLLNCLASWADV